MATTRIGNIELGECPLLLAPMEDVSDPPFRYVCKQFGADLMYTEFISSEGLIRDAAKWAAEGRGTVRDAAAVARRHRVAELLGQRGALHSPVRANAGVHGALPQY